jgi:hypothetical protein
MVRNWSDNNNNTTAERKMLKSATLSPFYLSLSSLRTRKKRSRGRENDITRNKKNSNRYSLSIFIITI